MSRMNKDVLSGNWKQLRGEVRKRWGKLTDDEIDQIGGSSEKLLGRIQERYGLAKDQAQKELNEFFSAHASLGERESRERSRAAGTAGTDVSRTGREETFEQPVGSRDEEPVGSGGRR